MQKNGFTMVELLIVVGIIAILSTFGWNGMTRQWQRNAVNDAKLKIPMIIRNVLEKSFQEGRPFVVTMSTSSNGKAFVVVQNINGGTVSSIELSDKIKTSFTLKGNGDVVVKTIDTTSSGSIDIDITETGGFATTIGSIEIVLKDKENKNKLQVIAKNIKDINVGKVDVYLPNGNGWNKIKGM